ncbi:MAG: hypothetical protein HY554_00205 [Elusimicrobia bacterium]|nr:hypothetical protein [Elusimicrobiota bacterium]
MPAAQPVPEIDDATIYEWTAASAEAPALMLAGFMNVSGVDYARIVDRKDPRTAVWARLDERLGPWRVAHIDIKRERVLLDDGRGAVVRVAKAGFGGAAFYEKRLINDAHQEPLEDKVKRWESEWRAHGFIMEPPGKLGGQGEAALKAFALSHPSPALAAIGRTGLLGYSPLSEYFYLTTGDDRVWRTLASLDKDVAAKLAGNSPNSATGGIDAMPFEDAGHLDPGEESAERFFAMTKDKELQLIGAGRTVKIQAPKVRP